MSVKLWVIGLVGIAALIGATGQIFLKLGANNLQISVPALLQNWYLLLGLTLYGTSALIYIFSLQFGKVSLIYPIIATSYIWVALFANRFLGEAFPLQNWAGVVMIVAGVTLIHL